MTDPEFLDLEDVLIIHEDHLGRYGGLAGLRDQGLLESAVGMPRVTFGGQFVHEDLFAMAAAYASTSRRARPSSTGTSEPASWPPSSSSS